MSTLHAIALARGVAVGGGCDCAVCGPSPFDASRPAAEVITDSFSDRAYLRGTGGTMVCAGCVSVLSGRPGDDPPPLRMLHALVVPGEPLRVLTLAELGALLESPPEGRYVLIWATSRQRHASLRADWSEGPHQRIGADDGTIHVEPEHADLRGAVRDLLVGFTRDAVRLGTYTAPAIVKFGASRWRALETVVHPHRGTLLLDLFTTALPKSETTPDPKEPPMLTEHDQSAAELLRTLAAASALRRADGLTFWNSVFLHRVQRFARLPLPDFVSRMSTALEIDPTSLVGMVRHLREGGVDGDAVMTAIRQRAPLLVAVAYQMIKES